MAHSIVSLATKSRPQDRSHAGQFLKSLSRSQRNALRVLLMQSTGLADLRETLGINHMQQMSVVEQRTGHALRGTTAELFAGAYTDILPLDKNVEVGQ